MSVNGLEKITDKILADARERAQEILSRAEAESAEITKAYEARADEIRERLSADAERRGEDMVSRGRSAAAMKKRNLLLEQRSQLIDGVFTSAKDWVLSLSAEQYAELLAGLLASALYELTSANARNQAMYGEESDEAESYEVLLNKKDRDAVGESVISLTKKKLQGKVDVGATEKLSLGKPVTIDGGVILCAGEVEFNCSLSMLFSQLKRELEAEVNEALFAPRGQNA